MSLRDQLIKAGLVTEDQAKKAAADARKQSHNARKPGGDPQAAVRAAQQRRLEEEARRKRERDRELNLQREAERKRREALQRAQQLIAEHRQNVPDAEVRYSFVEKGRFVRSIWVTDPQQQALADGRLAIARAAGPHRFALIPAEVARQVQEVAPERVLLLHDPSDNTAEESAAPA
jgi:uncharacterized protein